MSSMLRSAFLLGLSALPSVFGANYLQTFSNGFKDPYATTAATVYGDALLDMNVQTKCPGQVEIAVHLPTTGATTVFNGPDFGPRLITGVSQHNNYDGGNGLGNTFLTKVYIQWDNTNKILTFTGFDQPDAKGVLVPTTVNDGSGGLNTWYNINFDIVDTDFNPVDNGVDNVPLMMVGINGKTAPFTILLQDGGSTWPQAPGIFEARTNAQAQCGGSPPCDAPGGCGDPVFAGFQGQVYQFHGLPDEHFNLVSSPDLQLNSHFVYLSSGKCDYNDTECFTHPGTYMDVLGFSIADSRVKVVAGTHEQGLRVWVNDAEIQRGAHFNALNNNVTSALRYHHNGRVEIKTDVMSFEVVNSDMFLNIRAALNDQQLLKVGAKHHTVTDHAVCKTNTETHNHQLVERTVAAKYPVNTPLHGLIGQTWRNVKVCGKDWMGTVQDYLVSDLFATDNHYLYFKW
jgi:hypothetical protein